MPDVWMRGAKLWWRIIRAPVLLLMLGVLAACSAVRLAYPNLPTVTYWWLDTYLDFNGAQTPQVRDDLARLLEWHRREELPRVAGLLQKARTLAPQEVSAEQACALADDIRDRLLAFADQAEVPGTTLALSLDESQLRALERKYEKINAEWRKDWLDLSPRALQQKRYERFLDREEDFYGRLDGPQRERLREISAQSVFDPALADRERRRRQREIVALLRRLRSENMAPAQARTAIHGLVRSIADPPPGPWRDHQQALLQEGCRNVAALHNMTTPTQRANAVRKLRAYEDDLRLLAGGG